MSCLGRSWPQCSTGLPKRMKKNRLILQSDRNSSKTDTFHEPTDYEPHVKTSSEEIQTSARHEYGRVGVLKIRT